MKRTVKDLIHQLEKRDPNEPVFALVYTKDDVKELEHYDPDTDEVVYPYNDDLAEKVINSMDDYDSIYEYIYSCMEQEISYQVNQQSKLDNLNVETPSY